MRFTVEAGGHRARAVAFGMSRLPDGDVHDATFTLELNEWNGAVEPRLVLRHAQAPAPAAVALVGEPEDPVAGRAGRAGGAAAGGGRDVARGRRPARPAWGRRGRHAGGAGGVRRAGARGVRRCAPAPRAPRGPPRRLRRRGVARARTRPGARSSATRTSSRSTRRRPMRRPRSSTSASRWPGARRRRSTHCARTKPRTTCARRPPRSTARCATARCAGAVAAAPSPAAAGRALRAPDELGLVRVDGASVKPAPARRTELDASAAFRAYTTRLAEGRARLGRAAARRRGGLENPPKAGSTG